MQTEMPPNGQLLSLTAEQRERIRRNRERALMLRAMNVGSEQGGRSKNEIERRKRAIPGQREMKSPLLS